MAHKISRCLVSLLLALAMTAIPFVPRSAHAAGPWYVIPTGDDNNDCLSPGTACATINGALGKASAGDVINIAVGTYTGTGFEVVFVDKSVTLAGGWDVSFTAQSGMSILDGQGQRRGISSLTSNVTIFADHFTIQNGFTVVNGGGIGISNFGSLILSNSLVTNNTANSGGGIAFAGSLTLNDSTVRDNIASNGGGGIWNLNGNLTLNNSTISGNTTGEGGGGIKDSGFMTILNNSTVSENLASGNGGGINYGSNNLILNNSSVGGNSAGNAGGGLGADTTGGSVTLRNTILADNTAVNGPDCSGLIGSSGYNLIGNSSECTFTSTMGDFVGTSLAPINPGWDLLQDNGGPTFTRALLPASPAINAGNPAGCTDHDGNLLATDQRGITRPQGMGCDIGAYEHVFTDPGSATSLAVILGSGQVSFLNEAFPHPLRVVALDDQGNRVSGVTVTFTAPANDASGTFADTGTNITTVDTDAGGVATTSIFTANNLVGAYVVAASAPGLGSVSFNLEQKLGLADDFANATVISSLPFDDTVDTTTATIETGEPTRPSCVFSDLAGSVWYAFTPTTSGSVSASTFNLNGFATLVAAYTGDSLTNLTELGCQTFLSNQVTFHVDSGTTYYLQIGVLGFGLGGVTQVHMEVTPSPLAAFLFFPNPPSTLDFVQFIDNSNDPGQIGIETFAWDFGDGMTSTESNPSHLYAADGDYTVEYSITTFDGRFNSTSQVVEVRTHDVSIAKITTPRSANAGQTRSISVSIRNTRYPETVRVDLYKSTPSGEVWIDSLTLQVPVLSGNKTRQFTFNYTFTSEDADIGKVTFRAEAFIEGANDAFPQDNLVFSSPPTRVGR